MPNYGTPVPKRELIELLLRNISDVRIRELLNIQFDTDLRLRLNGLSKNQLLEVLESSENGRNALEETKANYPFSSNPTLYLLSVGSWLNFQDLLKVTTNLVNQMQGGAVHFDLDRTVQSVFVITPAKEIQSQLLFQEVPLVYVKKIEYVIADPESEKFGENAVVYSLEKAIIWYCNKFNHALLLCGDFKAVKPILDYCRQRLSLSLHLPYLSEEMLGRLAEGAIPRTASFSRLGKISNDNFDTQSLTISDISLGESRSYQLLSGDPSRQQTFGFYSSHPDLVLGGMGISRQYGRIWTPSHLRKDSLLALSINLIRKTESELKREKEKNPSGFISYYRNVPIKLGEKTLASSRRYLFEGLIKAIIEAQRSPTRESRLKPDLINDLLEQYQYVDAIPVLEIHCDNCGSNLALCVECDSPLTPIVIDHQLTFQCSSHPSAQQYQEKDLIPCDCGAEIEVAFSADIRILPGAQLLQAIHEFLPILENQQYSGSFIISGEVLRWFPRNKVPLREYKLPEFQLWQTRAHIHQRIISDEKRIEYQHILSGIKEKCARNKRHSASEICAACIKEVLTTARIYSGTDLCLSRLFGYAIYKEFDGVHHGHEGADIRYDDVLLSNGETSKIGIHLKSREKPKPQGLGRSVFSIKGLYTQYCYSANIAMQGKIKLDVIGISIPNTIHGEVRDNFGFMSRQFGFPLIILDEEDWYLILEAAIERAYIEN